MEVSLRGSYGVQLQPDLRATYPHHCVLPGLLASGLPIVLQPGPIFSFVVTGFRHADLISTPLTLMHK